MITAVPETASLRGFTLIEVMVALVIVSLGMMAVNSQLNRYVVGASFIEEKTLASWIGTNALTELGLSSEWPEVGDRSEQVEFAGRHWHLRIEVAETPIQNLRRADVHVSNADAPDRVLHSVTALIEPPLPRGFAPLRWPPPIDGADG